MWVIKGLGPFETFFIKKVESKWPFYINKLNIIPLLIQYETKKRKGGELQYNPFFVTKALDPCKEQGQGLGG